MNHEFYWTKEKKVLVVMEPDLWENTEGLVELNDSEIQLFLNPPIPSLSVDFITSEISKFLDDQAKNFGYDGIVSAVSYAGYENDYQNEAIALGKWRSSVWSSAYVALKEIEDGKMEMPKSIDEVIAMLPKFEVTDA